MKLILGVEDLAEALNLSVDTVRQYASRAPEKLPPRCMLPYSRVLWSLKDVEDWIAKHSLKEAA
jgi:predicted DNA-binding transcriptional regulator AlpA